MIESAALLTDDLCGTGKGAQTGRLPVAARALVLLVRGDGALGDAHLVDFIGAVGEARPAGVLVHVGEGVSVE
ncbi:MAG: hypothetical protein U1F09_16590 [Steroidobacteraceae bacterium]